MAISVSTRVKPRACIAADESNVRSTSRSDDDPQFFEENIEAAGGTACTIAKIATRGVSGR
jgi:hypothetical protein